MNDSYITSNRPNDRNNGPIPHLDPGTHTLQIDGSVSSPVNLNISQLKNDYPQHEVLCALQCAGNRRHTMRTLLKEVQGIDWFDAAVMNCTWKGPRVRDLLLKPGIKDDLKEHDGWRGHVAFSSYETYCQDDKWYGGSIPLSRAMANDGDCILALEMNGEALTPKHGAPVRAICPGILGARSVKWLNGITLQLAESPTPYHQHDYKILPPEAVDAESANGFWDKVPPMCNMPINSVVGIPKSASEVATDADGMVTARGYALPAGGDGPIKKVEVSGDDGKTWTKAELDFGSYVKPEELETQEGRRIVKWAWCLWKAKIKVERGQGRRIVCRAPDYGSNTQPEQCAWYLRGVGYKAWGEARDLIIV